MKYLNGARLSSKQGNKQDDRLRSCKGQILKYNGQNSVKLKSHTIERIISIDINMSGSTQSQKNPRKSTAVRGEIILSFSILGIIFLRRKNISSRLKMKVFQRQCIESSHGLLSKALTMHNESLYATDTILNFQYIQTFTKENISNIYD